MPLLIGLKLDRTDCQSGAMLMFIEMINEVVKFNQLGHEMPRTDDLEGNNKKDKLFHLLKVRFSA